MENTINIRNILSTSLVIKEIKVETAHTYNFFVYQMGKDFEK